MKLRISTWIPPLTLTAYIGAHLTGDFPSLNVWYITVPFEIISTILIRSAFKDIYGSYLHLTVAEISHDLHSTDTETSK